MKQTRIETLGFFLGLALVWTIWRYRNLPHMLAAGEPYLCSASCAGLFFAVTFMALRKYLGISGSEETIWLLKTRSKVFLIAAWQLLILAVLNIWAATPAPTTFTIFSGSYLLAAGFVILSDRIIALADRSDQSGGSKPLKYFGEPRSRRTFFWGFVVYPESALAFAGVHFWIRQRPYPQLFQPPQLCLLLITFTCVGSALLVFHRYRQMEVNKLFSNWIFLAILLTLASAAIVQIVLSYNLFVFIMSIIVAICIGASLYWSRATPRQPTTPSENPLGPKTPLDMTRSADKCA
jgi:hypothetical protein